MAVNLNWLVASGRLDKDSPPLPEDADPMGLMRFVVSPPERLTEEAVQQAYLSGIDRVCWPVRASVDGGQLVLQRAVTDSANLHFLWPVKGCGRVVPSTATLIEEHAPYLLPLELARGTISQLRNQLYEWQVLGLMVPEAVTAKVPEAMAQFKRAVVAQEDPQSPAWAECALQAAVEAGNLLAAAYIEQAIAVRRRVHATLPTLLGADLGSSPLEEPVAKELLPALNAAVAGLRWRGIQPTEADCDWSVSDRQIEWCRAQGLTVCAGPLLCLDPRGLPDWLYLWEDDFESLLGFASEFIHAAVSRYRGKVELWQCAGRVNTAEALSLSEEDKLRLAARSIELVRSLDPGAGAVLSLDQPWAEYMTRRETDFPPLHFADALVRAGLPLTGLMLEINVGYHPGGTLPRTPLELSRYLDLWSLLGLPLYVSLSVPSATEDDPLAQRRVKLSPGSWTPQAQQAWVARYVPLLLAKPYVQGVFWNQLRDAQPHDFPHGGLLDATDQPKPALGTLAAIRQAYLK